MVDNDLMFAFIALAFAIAGATLSVITLCVVMRQDGKK